MIFTADSKVTFTGAARFDRALEFVRAVPAGAAVAIDDGSVVLMKRTVKATYALATAEERNPRGKPVPALLAFVASILFLFFTPAVGVAAGMEGMLPPVYVGAPAVAPFFEEVGVQMSEISPMIAEITTGNSLLDKVLAGVAGLLGYHFIIRRYIREAAGVKEQATPTTTTIMDQPVKVQGVVRFVAHEELENRLEGYVTSDELHDTEQRLDGKIEKNFRDLDDKRSRSIGNLHEHLTGTARSLSEKISAEVGGSHDRINQLGEKLGVVIGELRQIAEIAKGAADTAQRAAVSAASSQRGKP